MKSPFKKLMLAGACCCLLAAAVPLVSAQYGASADSPMKVTSEAAAANQFVKPLNVTAKKIEEKTDLYQVSMSIPVITGMLDTSFEKKLNESIENQAAKQFERLKHEAAAGLKEAKEGGYEFNPYMLDFAYTIKSSGGSTDGAKLSIVVETSLYMGGARGTVIIDTYNVSNSTEASYVTLEQLLGPDYINKANEAVNKAIKQQPERFFTDEVSKFQTIDADQTFYIANGKAVLVFQPGDISPPPVGIVDIPVE
jgi:hypothetical protein